MKSETKLTLSIWGKEYSTKTSFTVSCLVVSPDSVIEEVLLRLVPEFQQGACKIYIISFIIL